MKKFIYPAAIGLAILFTLNSCGEKDIPPVVTPPEDPALSAAAPAEAPKEGGELTFDITANVKWEIAEPAEEWLTVDPLTGENDAEITVKVDANTGEEREATLTITGENIAEPVTVKISQANGVVPVEKTLVDELVGDWTASSLMLVFDQNGIRGYADATHGMKIEKVDDTTVRMTDLVGMFGFLDGFQQAWDTVTATVDDKNRTITIDSWSIEPTWDPDGWPVYISRVLHEPISGNYTPNYRVGFENFPIDSDLSIDLGEGGFMLTQTQEGKPCYGTFVALSMDPSGKDTRAYFYNWVMCNTVLTKELFVAPSSTSKDLKPLMPGMDFTAKAF